MKHTPVANAVIGTAGAHRETMFDMFNRVAKQAGKTTIAQTHQGGWLVWVTPDEADPMTALLSAACSILVARGGTDGNKAVTIRKASVTAPGAEFFWQVTEPDGTVVGSGYVGSEREAAQEIAKHMLRTS